MRSSLMVSFVGALIGLGMAGCSQPDPTTVPAMPTAGQGATPIPPGASKEDMEKMMQMTSGMGQQPAAGGPSPGAMPQMPGGAAPAGAEPEKPAEQP